MKAKKQ